MFQPKNPFRIEFHSDGYEHSAAANDEGTWNNPGFKVRYFQYGNTGCGVFKRGVQFGLSDLENDLLTSTASEGAQWFFSKITFFKSVDQAEKNEL